jgi:uncharacterized Zn finger protein (UPF0148 family)
MAQCEMCGNESSKTFQVIADGHSYIFDSFECAFHMLASSCDHCGVKIFGHGFEADGRLYCCPHCAEESEIHALTHNSGKKCR